jgi:ribonuclease VapC
MGKNPRIFFGGSVILDASALVAILIKEPAAELLMSKLAAAESIGIGAPTLAEAGVVLQAKLRRDPQGMLARFLQEFEAAIIPFGEDHWREAVKAYRLYGKGVHPAGLNFGDCLSYAVAKLSGEELLFTGNDFQQTDLRCL